MHLNHLTARLTAAMLLVSTLITSASALTGTVKTGGGVLRVRSEASTAGKVLKNLSNGTTVEVLDALENGWYQVSAGGTTGYVSGDYLVVNTEAAVQDTATPLTDTPEAAPAAVSKTFVQVVNGPLNVRSAPSAEFDKVGSLPAGRVVEVKGLADGWYQTNTGYISAEYVKEVTLSEEIKAYVKVTDGPLNVRSAPSAESDKVGSLPVGKIVEVQGFESGWYQIGSGYINAEYVAEATAEEAQDAAAAAKSYVKVISGPLNVRSGPSTEYDKVGSLPTGKVVEVKGLTDGWYQISSGYINAEYVTEATAEEAQSSGKGQDIVNYALQYLGCRYVYGGSSPKGFDCSGFTSYVYKQCGYSINRTASYQLDNGRSVSKSELKPGDLVFFKEGGSGSRASHVGIYIGKNQFIHAANPTKGVVITSLDVSYYRNSYIGARRIVE